MLAGDSGLQPDDGPLESPHPIPPSIMPPSAVPPSAVPPSSGPDNDNNPRLGPGGGDPYGPPLRPPGNLPPVGPQSNPTGLEVGPTGESSAATSGSGFNLTSSDAGKVSMVDSGRLETDPTQRPDNPMTNPAAPTDRGSGGDPYGPPLRPPANLPPVGGTDAGFDSNSPPSPGNSDLKPLSPPYRAPGTDSGSNGGITFGGGSEANSSFGTQGSVPDSTIYPDQHHGA